MNTLAGRTAQARHLYDFLLSLSGRFCLSGQHNYIGTGDRYTCLVQQRTGRRPLVWGSDFSFAVSGSDVGKHFHCGPLNISDPGEADPHFIDETPEHARRRLVDCAIAQHSRGHIITLMWHCCFPDRGDCGSYDALWQVGRLATPETWRELTTPGTALHTAWLAQIDHIAAYLLTLRDAGVPVLWRPYHEMNGVWFWWCDKPGPQGFAKLWRMMHERYSDYHGLDNLLWVYNANAPRDRQRDEAYAYERYYPGGEYVDVLAADVYGNDYRQSHHDDLVALADGRPVALGEVGEVPTAQQMSEQPRWCWFMPWGALALWRHNTQKLPALYTSPRVLSCEDVERLVDGSYRIRADRGLGATAGAGDSAQ